MSLIWNRYLLMLAPLMRKMSAYQHSSGASGLENQAISKSAGGSNTKIHLAVDSHVNPVKFIISDGTTHDVKVAQKLVGLMDLSHTKILCADKGYD